jgi:hypothetical protein
VFAIKGIRSVCGKLLPASGFAVTLCLRCRAAQLFSPTTLLGLLGTEAHGRMGNFIVPSKLIL